MRSRHSTSRRLDYSQTYQGRSLILRTRLKKIRKLIEAKESFHCPACMSENVVLDETQELGTFYECLTCNMSGWIDD